MKTNSKFIVLLIITVILGVLIAWVDSRPNWDNTGITAGMIIIVSGVISFFYPSRPIIWALAVSGWIPIYGIIKSADFSMLLVLLFGFIGAFIGSFTYKIIHK